MNRLVSFWRNLLRRDRVEQDLDDEMRATLEILADEKERAGMTRPQARRAAVIELGGTESIKEQVRDARSGAFLETCLQDLRYAARLLRRQPLFAATAALSLAIGIGATTTIFTVANGLLLRTSAGVADPEALVDVVKTRSSRGVEPGLDPISYPEYLDVRRRVTTLDDVYAYQLDLSEASLRESDGAERVFTNVVSMNYFTALGVRAAAGRVFLPGDSEQAGASPVVVLSHQYWSRRFDADAGIVGRTVRLNGFPVTVVGVAADGFSGTSVVAPDLWAPIGMVGLLQPEGGDMMLAGRGGWLMVGARLKPGVSRAQASAELRSIGAAIEREFPTPNLDHVVAGSDAPAQVVENVSFDWTLERASPIPHGLRLVVTGFLTLLMVLVSIVLVVACANIAGILLARATTRRRELALRTAIGAGRGRIVRQLLTETMLLFVLGGAVGLGLARLMTSATVLLLPAFPVPINLSTPLDSRVVLFSLSLSFIAALLSGLAPALEAAKTDVISGLKEESQGPGDRARVRHAFVVVQVAFSTLLVVMAAVFAGGLERATSIDRGFDPRGVDVAMVDLSMAGYTEATGPSFARELMDRVRRLPGIQSASLADRIPGPGTMSFGGVTIPGVTPPNGAPFFSPNWLLIEAGYFATLGIPLVAGRDFDSDERAGSAPVAIVNASAARRFWPNQDPIGQILIVRGGNLVALDAPPAPPAQFRVVGVVGDMKRGGERPASFDLYVPWQQRYRPKLAVFIRRAETETRAGALRTLIAGLDRNLPVLSAQTLESHQNGPVETQLRVSAIVAGSVGLVGLLLVAIGVYGVTAHAVARRTREIGIRLSLGAASTDVVRLVLRQGMVLVVTGCAIGLALGAGAGRLLSRSPLDVSGPPFGILAGTAALFAIVGLIACYVPVRRAIRIQATEALRYE
jgi:predicted permease